MSISHNAWQTLIKCETFVSYGFATKSYQVKAVGIAQLQLSSVFIKRQQETIQIPGFNEEITLFKNSSCGLFIKEPCQRSRMQG